MKSLVLELQSDALNPSVRVSDLVRKALVVSTKLNIPELRDWCQNELTGYREATVPRYRKITGEIKAFNPYQGWMPVRFQSVELAETLAEQNVGTAVGEIEHLLVSEKDGVLVMNFPGKLAEQLFSSSRGYELGIVPQLVIQHSILSGILDSVRNNILEWSLRLEQSGIIGEGMTFSREEKEKAAGVTYNINSFQGVLGDVHGGTLQIGDFNTLSQELRQLGIEATERAEIEGILHALARADETEKPALAARGRAWLTRNADAIGAIGKIIGTWLTTLAGQ
jgi:hypothetical protein